MPPALRPASPTGGSARNPTLFFAILGLIVFFLVAFFLLRGNGVGSTRNAPGSGKSISGPPATGSSK